MSEQEGKKEKRVGAQFPSVLCSVSVTLQLLESMQAA